MDESRAALLLALRLTSRVRTRRTEIRCRLAELLRFTGEPHTVMRLVRRALTEIHQGIGDPRFEPGALIMFGCVQRSQGLLTAAIQTLEQAVSVTERRPGGTSGFDVLSKAQLALTLTERDLSGDMARAGELLHRLLEDAAGAVSSRQLASLLNVLAHHELRVGDLESAERTIARAASLGEPADSASQVMREVRAELLVALGRPGEAIPLLNDLLRSSRAKPRAAPWCPASRACLRPRCSRAAARRNRWRRLRSPPASGGRSTWSSARRVSGSPESASPSPVTPSRRELGSPRRCRCYREPSSKRSGAVCTRPSRAWAAAESMPSRRSEPETKRGAARAEDRRH